MFQGVLTALMTPFNKDGSIDYEALKTLTAEQIEAGISGLVPVGTTGESPTLSHEENIDVVKAVVQEAAGRVPVIAGTGSNCTAEAVRMTKMAKEVGADGSLQVAPYYNKPNQEGFYRHYSAIADETDLPLIVYNVPGRSGKNIETDTVIRLAAHPLIQAVKDASGSINQMMDVVARRPDGFSVLSGDDNLAFSLACAGGDGVISVASNLIPRRMGDMIRLAREGHLADARKLHYELLPLFKGMFLDTNPLPIKAAMAMTRPWCREVYRLPLISLTHSQKGELKSILKGCGLL